MKSALNTDWNPSRLPVPTSELPPLHHALVEYDRLNRRRFHVPAHSGFSMAQLGLDVVADPYRYDLTEVDGLDVLSEPDGCLLEAQAELAQLCGAAQSFFLVNGATVGLMAALMASVQPGDAVLLPRNVHRSVLSALILTDARPVWFLPTRLPEWGLWGEVSVEQVRAQLLAHPDIKALVITSPTYEGIGSDIQAISDLCHAYHVSLIVDEAHGSLWPFSDALPTSAIHQGADAVIHSIHKSGGALTQGALAHLPNHSQIDPIVFQQALNTLQTTSPSYLLMASVEAACHFLASPAGQIHLETLFTRVFAMRRRLSDTLTTFRLFDPPESERAFWDPAKLYLTHPAQTGEDWGALFEDKLQIAYESASPYGVLYLANLGLQPDDFEVLEQALLQGETLLPQPAWRGEFVTVQQRLALENPAVCLPEMAMTPRDAFFARGEQIPLSQALGRIAKETVVHCPPGIPVLLPGERIQEAHLPLLTSHETLLVVS